MRLGVRGSSLGLLVTDALGATPKGSVWMKVRGQEGSSLEDEVHPVGDAL